MKKITLIFVLLLSIIAGGVSLEAKTTKKKTSSSSTSSVKFGKTYDGYADIGGHSYRGSLEGRTLTVKFAPLNGSPNGVVDIKFTYKGQSEREINNWYYEGDGIIMFYVDGGTECYFQIINDGKELTNPHSGLTLKVVN